MVGHMMRLVVPCPTRTHLDQEFRCAERDVGHRHDGTVTRGRQEGLHPDQVVLRDTLGVVGVTQAHHFLVG